MVRAGQDLGDRRELSRRSVVDESLFEQPLDGPSLGSHIPQGLPG